MSEHKKGGFLGGLKDMFVEETPDTDSKPVAAAPKPTTAPTTLNLGSAVPSFVSPTIPSPVSAAPIGADSDDAYQRLFTKTDFDKTPEGLKIKEYLDKLAPVPDTVMAPAMKQTTAVIQAKAELGDVRILSAFDGLKAKIVDAQNAFAAKAQQFEANEITARSNRLTEIQNQIAQLQQEMSKVATELTEAQGKAAKAQGAFQVAVQRRSNEIDQQKATFAALLK